MNNDTPNNRPNIIISPEGEDDENRSTIHDDSKNDESKMYDVVICGTGLVQSILASSLALVGVSVLHCDSQDLYGEIDASYGLKDLISWAKQQQQQQQPKDDPSIVNNTNTDTPPSTPSTTTTTTTTTITTTVHPKGSRALLQVHSYHQLLTEEEEGHSRKFILDLMPRVLFANGPAVSGLISSSVSNYVEFMTIQGLFLMTDSYTLQSVPSSKSQVFQSTLLSPLEKRKLMKFLQLVLEYGELSSTSNNSTSTQPLCETTTTTSAASDDSSSNSIIDTMNERNIQAHGMSLRRPQNKPMNKSSVDQLLALTTSSDSSSLPSLQEYIQSQFLIPSSSYLSKVILHALCLQYTSTNQQQFSVTRGMDALVRHASSLGKYGDTAASSSAFIAPLYGTSELVQGFCRSCAVHGGVYMLRTTMIGILHSSPNNNNNNNSSNNDTIITGALLSQEKPQEDNNKTTDATATFPVACRHVVVPYDALLQSSEAEDDNSAPTTTKVLQRISVLRGTIQLPSQQQRSIVIIPPWTQGISNQNAIFVLILDASLNVCPVGYTVVYLSTSVSTSISSNEGDEMIKSSIQHFDSTLAHLLHLSSSSSTASTPVSTSPDHASAPFIEEQMAASSQPAVDEILQVTFSIPIDDDDPKYGVGKNSKINHNLTGLHVCKRPKLSITVDEAFEEAERIFNEIIDSQEEASCTTRPKFLMMSDEVRQQVKRNIIGIRNDDEEEEDDEKDILASAMDLIAPHTLASSNIASTVSASDGK